MSKLYAITMTEELIQANFAFLSRLNGNILKEGPIVNQIVECFQKAVLLDDEQVVSDVQVEKDKSKK